jgi:segregation and condensation protein B
MPEQDPVEVAPKENRSAVEDAAEPEAPADKAPSAEEAPPEARRSQAHPSRQAAEVEPTAKAVVEALLFASADPLDPKRIARAIDGVDTRGVRKIVDELAAEYEQTGRAFTIEEVAGGYQMFTRAQFDDYLRRLFEVNRESKLSQAALETLAIIAYRQPILRADIEAIRGVTCGPILRSLMDLGLARVVGKADALGRPLLYGTTRKFLAHFGLKSLKDLPDAAALVPPTAPPKPPEQEAETEPAEDAETAQAEEAESEPAPAAEQAGGGEQDGPADES